MTNCLRTIDKPASCMGESGMARTVERPIVAVIPAAVPGTCGFAHDEEGSGHCGRPADYRFKLTRWPATRYGHTCAEHALIVRRWDVEWMRTR